MTNHTEKPASGPGVRPRNATANPNKLLSLPPLALYVHVPWCVRKCPYCDFNSHELRTEIPEEEYLQALSLDLEQALPLIWGRQIVSVFIGGGTPSLLSVKAIDSMLATLRAYLNLWPETEITLEANPGASDTAKFKGYASSGINRLSIGVQSFNDHALKALGRIHDSDQAHQAILSAQQAFDNINIDLMFALPEQSIEQCKADIQTALQYNTQHLSLYNLTLEPNTVFAKYPPNLPNDDTSAAMQELLVEYTGRSGYERYEVSAYAKRGHQSVHNVNYWEFGDYLGIGPGAHSKISFPDKIIRQARLRNPNSWIQTSLLRNGSHISENTTIENKDFPFEFMLNALRLKSGVPASYFFERTGQSYSLIAPIVNRLRVKGLLENNPLQLQATDLGWRFLNDLQSEFL